MNSQLCQTLLKNGDLLYACTLKLGGSLPRDEFTRQGFGECSFGLFVQLIHGSLSFVNGSTFNGGISRTGRS